MEKISNKNMIKMLTRQIERAEARTKGRTIDYREGELDYLVKALKQIKDEYKALEYVGKPFAQSAIDFNASINQHSIDF